MFYISTEKQEKRSKLTSSVRLSQDSPCFLFLKTFRPQGADILHKRCKPGVVKLVYAPPTVMSPEQSQHRS